MSSEKDDSKNSPLDPGDLNQDPLEYPKETKPAPRSRFWNSVRRAAPTFERRLAERELIVGEIPVVDGLVAAYEIVRFGKQVHHFIEEERELQRAYEASRKVSKNPFYRNAEKERVSEASRVYKKEDKIRDTLHAVSKDGWDEISSNVRHTMTIGSNSYRPSVHELLSKAGSNSFFQIQEKNLLDEASTTAKNFEKKYFEGTANDKYQYLITEAKQALEQNYFDRIHHPDRVLRLEKFAAERLYTDGHSVADIQSAITEKSPFMRGIDHKVIDDSVTYDGSIDNKIRYLKEITDFSHPGLNKEKSALADWRKAEGISQFDRRTPYEFLKAESQRAKDIARDFAEKSEKHMSKNFLEAYEMLEKYKANPTIKLTTKEEYQVELGRRLSLNDLSKYDIRRHDKEVAETLILVGHKAEDVSKALNEKSLKMETDYGVKILREIYDEMKHKPSIDESFNKLREYKERNSIPHDETRLDKLGLEHKQSPQQKDISQTHNRNNPDNSLKRDSPDNSLEH